jgi:hypothetical protein
MKVFYNRKLSAVARALEGGTPGEPFTETMVEGLPLTARRYLLHSIKPGTPLASSVHLKMRGTIRLKPGTTWMPMQAEQVISVPRGYVWKATADNGLLRMSGGDYYFQGDARVRFWLWGMIPVANSGGPDVARSAAGRLAVESVLFPTALLPQNGARWEPVDDQSATVLVKVGNEVIPLTLSIGAQGEARQVRTRRWGDSTEDGSFGYIPFGGELSKERTFGGYTIPSKLSVLWWPGTVKQFEFFRADIEEAEFR